MKKSTFILLLIPFLLCNCKSKLERIEINDGTMVVVNNQWVLTSPTEYVTKLKNQTSIKRSDIPLSEITYATNLKRIINLTDVTEFNPDLGIDFEFVKNIDPKKEIFYMVDGIPSSDYRFVWKYLISRKVKEINHIGINQAIAIWGKRDGKNGAIQINTFDKGDVVIPIITN